MKAFLSLSGIIIASTLWLAGPSFAQSNPAPNPATGGTIAPIPPKDAPSAPGSQTANNAEKEADSIAARIEEARKQGKDVRNAEVEEKQGEAALQAGYKAEAAQHFQRAKEELARESGGV